MDPDYTDAAEHQTIHIQQAGMLLFQRFSPDVKRTGAALMPSGDRDLETLLRQAQAMLAKGRLKEAIPAFRRVINAAPEIGIAELGLAIALGQSGDAASAERAACNAIAKGCDNAGSRYVLARSLFDQRRDEEAEAAFRQVLRLEPDHAQALVALGEVVWQRTGNAEQASATVKSVSRTRSVDLVLFLAEMAREAHGHEAELAMLEQEIAKLPPPARNRPLRFAAARAALLCDAPRALDHAEIMLRETPGDRSVYGLCGDALLAAGRADAASTVAGRLREVDRNDGHAIALQASAWRMLGDSRYGDLYDYSRFINVQTIDVPAGWNDLPGYLSDLACCLRALHGLRAHPLDQTLRGGSQIELHPEQAEDRALRAFPQAITGPINRYLQALGHGEDAFRCRNRNQYRLDGIWSVLLRSNGYHFNHYHGKGWISSACYIDIPDSLGRRDGEGWLKFGEPVMPTEPPLPAEYFVKPSPGLLALFPSWMWHGTVPFSGPSGTTRLTIAFDLVPG